MNLSLWRHADFMKLWVGQTISQFGSRITRGALPLAAVVALDASPLQMGLLAAAEAAPVLLFGLAAGVAVDRFRRKPLLIATDLGRALILAWVPLAAVLGLLQVWQLYVVAALCGILTVFFDVAYQSYLPSLVPRERLVEGNSRLALSSSAAEIGGPALGGVLVQWLTAPFAILLDAVSFLVSALFLGLIRAPERETAPDPEASQGFREALAGVRLLLAQPLLRGLAGAAATLAFFGRFLGTLYTLYALRELGMNAWVLGVVIAFGGLGELAGSVAAEPAVRRFGLGRTLLFSVALTAGAAFLIPLAHPPLPLAVGLMIAAQLVQDSAWTVFLIHEMSLRQALVPDALLGRASAGAALLSAGGGPIGAVLGGVAAQFIGMRAALVVAAVGMTTALFWTRAAIRHCPATVPESQP